MLRHIQKTSPFRSYTTNRFSTPSLPLFRSSSHKSQFQQTPAEQAGFWTRILEKIASYADGEIKTAPRARKYPDSRYRAQLIDIRKVYNKPLIYKVSLTNFAHKLHHYVTQIDPYYTQCGALPSILECFAVADCLRDKNEHYLDFKGDSTNNMIQFWLELITTGSETLLHLNTKQIDETEFEKDFMFVDDNFNDIIYNKNDTKTKYVIIQNNLNESVIKIYKLVGVSIESEKCSHRINLTNPEIVTLHTRNETRYADNDCFLVASQDFLDNVLGGDNDSNQNSPKYETEFESSQSQSHSQKQSPLTYGWELYKCDRFIS